MLCYVMLCKCLSQDSCDQNAVIDERPKSPIEKRKRNLKKYSPISRRERERDFISQGSRGEREIGSRKNSSFEKRKEYSFLKLQKRKGDYSPFSRWEREI